MAIGMLLLTNAATGAYIFATQMKPSGSTVESRPATSLARKAMVQGANLRQNSEMQACYETFLRRGPTVDEGVVEMHWLLETTGRISSLRLVKTDLDDQQMMECMMEALNAMTFRAPKEATMVAHKFNFRRRSPSTVNF